MDTSDELRLVIHEGAQPIAGSLGLPDGRILRFEGYLQLVAFLEGLRGPTGVGDDQDLGSGDDRTEGVPT